jgi:mannose-6-phosphate isomerase-like protein (cupin superfamily)
MTNPTKTTSTTLKSKSISYSQRNDKYINLLSGSPETISMRSGYVILPPGESIGMHSTGDNEEMLIPLSGTGELLVPGNENLGIHSGCVLYNPPHTQHDVLNTGNQPLKYIFIVSKAE